MNDVNIPEELTREAALLGEDNVKRLMSSTVAVFGLGGVGGYAAEALCRSGIGRLLLIDGDSISRTNINRQIFATQQTVGMDKTAAAYDRLHSIFPDTRLDLYQLFYNADTADRVPISECDCVIDAIDTISSKLLIIEKCKAHGVEIVSCMGAGNKLDPSQFEAADISETSFCPLARIMRKELHKRNIENVRVIYSREPAHAENTDEQTYSRRPVPASAAFCVPAAGILAAAEAVRLLLR